MGLRKFIRLPQLSALRIAMFFAVVFLVLGFYQEVVHAFRFHFLEQIEYKALDSFFLFRGQIHPQKEDVAIVAIDEKSIEYWGRWPWDRQKHALLLRRLGELGFIAGEPLHLLRRGPGGREPLAVQVGDTLFALRWLEACCIEVEPV